MKLFGDTGRRSHARQEQTPPADPLEKMPSERQSNRIVLLLNTLRDRVNALGKAPIWKHFRLPATIFACAVLLILILVLALTLWERPPDVADSGPTNPNQSIQAVHTPVPEPSHAPEETLPPEGTAAPEPTEEPMLTGRREDCYTFVVLGHDPQEGNTDTILVGRLDTAAGTLDVVSIPRDTLVNVSWGVKKLNTVLSAVRGDAGEFLANLGGFIGFTPDCYAIVDNKATEKLVDCIGGVYYNVPRDMDYEDPIQNLSIHIPQGYRLLSGAEAMQVLRYRLGENNSGYLNGDLGRISTQQDFLSAMLQQFLKTGNIPNLARASELFLSMTRTDLTAANLAFFAHEFLLLDRENIRFHTLQGKGVSIRGGYYFEADADELVKTINEYLNPYYQDITADGLNILQSDPTGEYGAVSITGEKVPLSAFYDFSRYQE